MKKLLMVLGLALWGALALAGCGGSIEGGTETGTTDPTKVGARVQAVASVLVPSITGSGSSSVSELAALTYGASSDWDTYLNATNAYVLTDIFGDPDDGFRVVTKIRVLLEQFKSTVENIFNEDPDVSCTGRTILAEGDTIEIAFYETVSNGTSSDRFFDCMIEEPDQGEITLYGKDSAGVIRVAAMSDLTSDNSEETATRGDEVRILAVVSATYGETTEAGATVGYLDLQFAHGSAYNGVDGVFATDDDVIFRSRTRITGRAVLDEDGNPTLATGDFTSTKYDASSDNNGTKNETVTKAIGRGSFGASEYSLFKVDSNVSSLDDIPGTFCIQQPSDSSGIPTHADATNCTSLETALAWGSATFPFTLAPSIDTNFEDKTFFEGNDTDLISNDGSNFTVPSYTTTP